jgi:hypothetical protein
MNKKKSNYFEIDFLLITKLNILANYYDITVNESSEQYPLNFNFKNFDNLKINVFSIQSYFSQLFGNNTNKIFLNLDEDDNIDCLLVFFLRYYDFRLYMIFKPKNNALYKFREEELVIINWIHVYSDKIKKLKMKTQVKDSVQNNNFFGTFFYHFYTAQYSSDKFSTDESYYSNQIRNIYQDYFKRKQIWFQDPASILNNKDDFIKYFDFYENFIDKDFILLNLFKKTSSSNLIKLADYVFYDDTHLYFTIYAPKDVNKVIINEKTNASFEKRNQFLVLNSIGIIQKNEARFEQNININLNDQNVGKKFILINCINNTKLEQTIKTLKTVNFKNIDEHKQFIRSIIKHTHEIEFREHSNLKIINNGVFERFENLKKQIKSTSLVISKLNHVFYAPDNNKMHKDVSFCLNILKRIPDILYYKMQEDKNLEMLNLFYKKYDQNFLSFIYKNKLITSEDFQNFELLRLLGLTLNNQGMFETSQVPRSFKLFNEFDLNVLPKDYGPKRYSNFRLETFIIEKYTNLIMLNFDFYFEILQITQTIIIINFEVLFKSVFWSELVNENVKNKSEYLELKLDFTKKNTTAIKSIYSSANFENSYHSWLALENHDKLILNTNRIKYENLYFKLYRIDAENLNFKKNETVEKYFLILKIDTITNITDYILKLQISDSFGNSLLYQFKNI